MEVISGTSPSSGKFSKSRVLDIRPPKAVMFKKDNIDINWISNRKELSFFKMHDQEIFHTFEGSKDMNYSMMPTKKKKSKTLNILTLQDSTSAKVKFLQSQDSWTKTIFSTERATLIQEEQVINRELLQGSSHILSRLRKSHISLKLKP